MTIEQSDVLRVTCNFILQDGTQYQNVYHYLFDGVGVIADATIVTEFAAQMQTAYEALEDLIRNDILNDLSSVDLVDFVTDQWEVIRNVGTFTLTILGTQAGDAIPNMSSAFVTLKTARPKSVGRKFLFPVVEAEQAQGILTPAAVTDIVAYTDAIIADIVVAVVNALQPGIVRTGINDVLLYTVGVVTNVIGTQRRRRPGVGA